MSFYTLIVLIHIFSAILGMGPGFILTSLAKRPKNIAELKYGFKLRTRLHIYVMVGGTLLLLTGLTMGYLNPALFQQFWYLTSLILFLLALGIGPIILSPISKPLKVQLKELDGESIPSYIHEALKRLFFWERIENAIFLVIILLMILKPISIKVLLIMFYLV